MKYRQLDNSRRKRTTGILFVVIGVVAMIGAGACTEQTPRDSSPASGSTFGDIASVGKTVYTNRCAGCHGGSGQGGFGPALIGSRAALGKYENAGALHDYISRTMPYNAPGSLARGDYEQVVGYLVLENGFTEASIPFRTGDLPGLLLKKAP